MARDAAGEPCPPSSDKACGWCLIGAMFVCQMKSPAYAAITALVKTYGFDSISKFNDHPDTTFGMVKGVIETYESTLPADAQNVVEAANSV